MTRSKRLGPVVRVAETRERDAAKIFGESRKNLEQHQNKLAELIAYRDDYNKRFTDSGSAGIDVRKMNEYRLFLSRLNQAIDAQKDVVANAELELEEKRKGWIHTRSRTQAMEKVVERFQDEEHRQEERKEQKESDERVTQTHSSRFNKE